MCTDTFNKHLHHNITSTCDLFKSWDAANFDIILLVSFRFHRHIVFLTPVVELFRNIGSEI